MKRVFFHQVWLSKLESGSLDWSQSLDCNLFKTILSSKGLLNTGTSSFTIFEFILEQESESWKIEQYNYNRCCLHMYLKIDPENVASFANKAWLNSLKHINDFFMINPNHTKTNPIHFNFINEVLLAEFWLSTQGEADSIISLLSLSKKKVKPSPKH